MAEATFTGADGKDHTLIFPKGTPRSEMALAVDQFNASLPTPIPTPGPRPPPAEPKGTAIGRIFDDTVAAVDRELEGKPGPSHEFMQKNPEFFTGVGGTINRTILADADKLVRGAGAIFRGGITAFTSGLRETGIISRTGAKQLTRDLDALVFITAVATGTVGPRLRVKDPRLPDPRLTKKGPVQNQGIIDLADKAATKAVADLPKAERMKAKAAVKQQILNALDKNVPTKAGNINLKNLDVFTAVKQDLSGAAKRNADFIGPHRGVVTNQETRDAADFLNMKVGDLLKRRKGQAFNDAELTAARTLLTSSGENLQRLALSARGGAEIDLVKFKEALDTHVAIQAQVSGATGEAGRTLQALRIKVGQDRAIKDIIDAAGGRQNIEDIATKIAAVNDPAQLNKIARDLVKTRPKDIFTEIWINGLLSGPKTQAVNITSNTLVAAWTIPEHFIASSLGAFRRGSDKVLWGENVHRFYGMIQGTQDGLFLAWKAFRTEETVDPITKLEQGLRRSVPSFTFRRGRPSRLTDSKSARTIFGQDVAIPLTGEINIGGKQIRIPGRALLAGDEFFKALGQRMDLNAAAYKAASAEGLKGRARAEFMRDFINAPPAEAFERAVQAARYQTFTKELGTFGKSIQAIANEHVAAKIIIPFVRTPVNIVKFAAERTLLAPLQTEVRKNLLGQNGKIAADIQRSKFIFGSMVSAATVGLALDGTITGGGPADPNLKRVMRARGWQPYSIKVADKYYSFARLEPLGIILGMHADAAEIGMSMGRGDEDIARLVVGSVTQNLTNKTFLRGLSEAIAAIREPQRYGDNFIRNLAGTVVPTGVAQIARVRDPTLREARTIMDKIRSRTPGLSNLLPPRLNVWGEAIHLEGGLGPDIVSPIYTSKKVPDKTTDELVRLDIGIGMPPRKINGVDLTTLQYNEFVKLRGVPMKRDLDAETNSPAWDSLSRAEKEIIIETIRRSHSTNARLQMLINNPDLFGEGERKQLEKLRQR